MEWEWYHLVLVFLAMGFLIEGVCGSGYCAEENSTKQPNKEDK